MIIDFNKTPHLSRKDYDYCICGAGAAGITLALELASTGKKIALFEGGNRDFTQNSQEIYSGTSIGFPYWLDALRLRYLGGTTNHWAGRCRPFSEFAFSRKEVNGLPGWPISFDEMDKYLPQAKAILKLKPENTFNSIPGNKINSAKFRPDVFTNSSVRFRDEYTSELEINQNIDLYLNANLVDIKLNQRLGSVEAIQIQNYDTKSVEASSPVYVLSMGAIENARILLNSNKQIKEGIGNTGDMVGRCFMEHFNIRVGEFVANTEKWSDMNAMQFMTTPEFAQQQQTGMNNISFGMVNTIKAYGRTAEIKKIFNKLSCGLGVSDKLQFIYKHDCVGEGVINTLCEQFPFKHSRVKLTEDKDKLGLKRVELNWQMSDADAHSIRTTAIAMAEEFAKNDLGRVKLSPFIIDSDKMIEVTHHAHQMGTTRMSDSSQHGVVDKNCKVHDISNLYIAGASVFSTGGGGNPTMPLIQLTYRLADYLENIK